MHISPVMLVVAKNCAVYSEDWHNLKSHQFPVACFIASPTSIGDLKHVGHVFIVNKARNQATVVMTQSHSDY